LNYKGPLYSKHFYFSEIFSAYDFDRTIASFVEKKSKNRRILVIILKKVFVMPFSVLVLKILDDTVLRAVLSMRWGEKLSSSEPCTQNLRYLLFADGDIVRIPEINYLA